MNQKTPLNILVIENNTYWLTIISAILKNNTPYHASYARTVNEANESVINQKIDLIIANVWLENQNILPFFSSEKVKNIPAIIMTTSETEELYLKVQEFTKMIFITKPFEESTLLSTISLLIDHHKISQESTEKVSPTYLTVFNQKQRSIKIYLESIVHIEAEGNYIFIKTKDQQRHARKLSLSKVLLQLNDQFIQVNKSFIININYINRMELGKRLIIVNHLEIAIGRIYRKNLDNFLQSQDQNRYSAS